MIQNWMSPKICHFGVKYSNSVLNCLSFIIIPLDCWIQIKVLINDLTLLLDLFGNSEGTKLLIWTVIFCLVFTAPEKWKVELRAKTAHYRNRCFDILTRMTAVLVTQLTSLYENHMIINWKYDHFSSKYIFLCA